MTTTATDTRKNAVDLDDTSNMLTIWGRKKKGALAQRLWKRKDRGPLPQRYHDEPDSRIWSKRRSAVLDYECKSKREAI
jgi:hypothetical protein